MRREWIILIIILVIAGFFRLYQLDITPPGLHPHEAANADSALKSLESGDYKVFYPENNGREGLFVWLSALSFKVFGSDVQSLRLVSAIIGILTVFALYLLAKELFTWQIAALSSFLLSITFWHVNFSRIGFRAILTPLLITLVLYFLWRGLKMAHKSDFILSGVFLGLGLYGYTGFWLVPLVVVVSLLIYWQKIKKDFGHSKYIHLRTQLTKGFTFILVASVLIALPIVIFALGNFDVFFERAGQVSVFSGDSAIKSLVVNVGQSLAMFNFAGDTDWVHNFSGEPQLVWPIGIFFVVGIIRAFWKCWKIKKEHGHFSAVHSLTLAWFFIMLAPAYLSDGANASRAIGVLPVVILFAAEGMWWLFDKLRDWYAANDVHQHGHLFQDLNKTSRNREANLAALLIIIVFLGATAKHQFDKYFIQWSESSEVAAQFDQDPADYGLE